VFRACESEARERRRDRDPIAIVILGGKSRRKKKQLQSRRLFAHTRRRDIFSRARAVSLENAEAHISFCKLFFTRLKAENRRGALLSV
jgi:hypothetical protein